MCSAWLVELQHEDLAEFSGVGRRCETNPGDDVASCVLSAEAGRPDAALHPRGEHVQPLVCAVGPGREHALHRPGETAGAKYADSAPGHVSDAVRQNLWVNIVTPILTDKGSH